MFSDALSWGYVGAVAIIIGAFACLITRVMDITAFNVTLGIGTGLIATTAALRSLASSTQKRVTNAIVAGTGDGSIEAKLNEPKKP